MPLRRSRRVPLPGGIDFQTPLLIPSLSTRNVGQLENRDSGEMESLASLALNALPGQLTESLLVSAFDLHNGRLVDAERLLGGAANTRLHEPQVLMVDSGQYEVQQRAGFDDAAGGSEDWSAERMLEVYRRLPQELPAALVNFDEDGLRYGEQIARARAAFAELPEHATVMLLKPEHAKGFIEPAKISAVAEELKWFSVVAVAEKELGNKLGERLTTLATLRRTLDGLGVAAPLHVFGGLDPLLTPLYVMCGAEMFDGVGWLRYAYIDDAAHYQESRAVLELDLDSRVAQRIFKTMTDNLFYMNGLKRRLHVLIADGDWQSFSEHRGNQLGEIWRRIEREAEGMS
jgi:hypothetical protein